MLTGTPSQVEWAEGIRLKVAREFNRVAEGFDAIAQDQPPEKPANTRALIAILEEKRGEVLARTDAGYFIRYWQEREDQVRQLIFHDPRYQEIKNPSAAEVALPDRLSYR